MSSDESWGLTPREFEARNAVRQQYLALWRTELRNAPHFHRQDKKPWDVSHFLEVGPVVIGDARAAQIEKNSDPVEMFKAAFTQANMRGQPPPDWLAVPYIPKSKRKDSNAA